MDEFGITGYYNAKSNFRYQKLKDGCGTKTLHAKEDNGYDP